MNPRDDSTQRLHDERGFCVEPDPHLRAIPNSPRTGRDPAGRCAGVSLGGAANVFLFPRLTVVKEPEKPGGHASCFMGFS
jgi:hypothetical protein